MKTLENLSTGELTALRFADEPTFHKATEVAVKLDIPVEPVGHHTLIVRRSDTGLFVGLKFNEKKVR